MPLAEIAIYEIITYSGNNLFVECQYYSFCFFSSFYPIYLIKIETIISIAIFHLRGLWDFLEFEIYVHEIATVKSKSLIGFIRL